MSEPKTLKSFDTSNEPLPQSAEGLSRRGSPKSLERGALILQVLLSSKVCPVSPLRVIKSCLVVTTPLGKPAGGRSKALSR